MNTLKPEMLEIFHRWATDHRTLIVEVQTTSREKTGEVIEIAILDLQGTVLLDTRVKPQYSIPPESVQFHGIHQAEVAHLPAWTSMVSVLKPLISGHMLVSYGRAFTKERLEHSLKVAGLAEPQLSIDWECLMDSYALYWGQPGKYASSRPSWQSHLNACSQQNIKLDDLPEQPSALSKAIRSQRLLQALSQKHTAQTGGEDSEPLPF